MTNETLVFVPAWNEQDNLPAVLAELRAEIPHADVLVVDDGSTDRTAPVAREHGAEVLSFDENRGLRAAIAAGYRYAAEHGYAYCGRVDADGQHPVSELRNLFEVVRAGKCDVAVGSRYATASGNGFSRERYETSPVRRLGTGLLRRSIEVVLTEVSFYAQSGIPLAAETIAFMSSVGFVLYDVASLSGRPRDNRLREGDLIFVRQDSQLLEDRRWE